MVPARAATFLCACAPAPACSIRQSGAVAFAEGLARNTRLEALDLGYNTFGSDAAVAALAGALRTNRALLHASVSHNGISARGCARLGAALAENHTLLGLHFDGNAGAVDPRGFVVRAGGGAGAAAADGAGHVGLFTRIVGCGCALRRTPHGGWGPHAPCARAA